MVTKINERVQVSCGSCLQTGRLLPSSLTWRGRTYRVEKIGFCFPQRRGRTLHHLFSLVAGGNFFKLDFNTESLLWFLEEVEG